MMLKAFTRNYEDNSTDAGFQFTFYCDICNDGFKSKFIESTTYKKGKGIKGLAQGASILGNLIGGRMADLGYAADRSSYVLSEKFDGMSPQWQKEHEKAFISAQEEAQSHFHRCIPATCGCVMMILMRMRGFVLSVHLVKISM